MQQRPRKGGCRLTELPEGRLGGVAARTVGGRADLVELLGELLGGGRARGDRLLGQIEHELEGVLGGRDDLGVWLLLSTPLRLILQTDLIVMDLPVMVALVAMANREMQLFPV